MARKRKMAEKEKIDKIIAAALYAAALYAIVVIKSPVDLPLLLINSFAAGWFWSRSK